jgi:predicted phage terminase large subunit-like protein
LQFALRNLEHLDPAQKEQVLNLLDERKRLAELKDAREHFLPFVKMVWPDFIPGAHHTIMADAFERVAAGTCTRLIINMPPRHTKSELASWLLPAWFLGRFPRKKIIQASNTENLAAGFGRRVRNLIDGEDLAIDDVDRSGNSAYQSIFPGIRLAKDSKAAAGWHTNKGGEYFAIGVNGKVAGKGGDIVIVDDPHSEQEAKLAESRPEIYDTVYDWYNGGPRQRLQPGGAIIIVMTRWSKRDLTGQVIKKMMAESDNPDTDKWEVISFPAILDEDTETERAMWPGFWPLKTLKATKSVLPVSNWSAQYQQNPTSEGAAIFKRASWRQWGADHEQCPGPLHTESWVNLDPPACDYIIQSWDCASTKNDRSHPSAFTEWGVFKAEDPDTGKTLNHIILLSAYKARMEFPELKRKAKQFYEESHPDTLLIENKSAGMQLLQEFRSTGIPAEDFSGSSRGSRAMPNDKIARANIVSDIFASRYVWAPARRFAEEVIEQLAEFPNGAEDDYVDSTVQAMIRFRAGGFIRTANDEDEDDEHPRYRRKRYY